MRNILWLLVGLLCSTSLSAQLQLGLRTENYAGVNALAINPAHGVYSELDWDVNLVGAGIFFETNYAYLDNTSLLRELNRLDVSQFALSNRMDDMPLSELGNTTVVMYKDTRRKYRYQSLQTVIGPGFMTKIGEQWSIGVSSAAKVWSNGTGIPQELNYEEYDNRPFEVEFAVDDLQFSLMSWIETGVNVAYRVPTYTGSLGLGMTVKFLRGYESGFLRNRSPFRMAKLQNMSFVVQSVDADFGYTNSNLAAGDDGFDLTGNGAGFGIDLGFTYAIEDRDGTARLRLSAALNDIGGIRFNRNAMYHRVRNDMPAVQAYDNYRDLSSVEQLPELVDRFLATTTTRDTPGLSVETNAYRIGLPSTFNLQADVRLHELFYVNTLLVQNLRDDGISVRQPSVLAVIPRFEHRWGSVAVPLSIYDYDRPRVGLALRAAYLAVGTDDLGAWLFPGELSSADVYVALKLNSFRFGKGDGLPTHRGKRNGKRQNCYRF